MFNDEHVGRPEKRVFRSLIDAAHARQRRERSCAQIRGREFGGGHYDIGVFCYGMTFRAFGRAYR